MKFKLLIYSFIAITGLTISCSGDLLIRRKITKELKVKSDEISIKKIDSLFLEGQNRIIQSYLSEMDDNLNVYDSLDKYSLFNYYNVSHTLSQIHTIWFDSSFKCALAKDKNPKIDCEYYDMKFNEISQIMNKMDSINGLILIELNRLGINSVPFHPKRVDTLNLYFVQKLKDSSSYVFDFDRENRQIDSVLVYE